MRIYHEKMFLTFSTEFKVAKKKANKQEKRKIPLRPHKIQSWVTQLLLTRSPR